MRASTTRTFSSSAAACVLGEACAFLEVSLPNRAHPLHEHPKLFLESGGDDQRYAVHIRTSEPLECSLCDGAEQWLDESCEDCDVGHYKGLGDMVCKECPAGSANRVTAQIECALCENGTSTNGLAGEVACSLCVFPTTSVSSGSATCDDCSEGYFKARSGSCKTERRGMDCSHRKACALETVPLKDNWWRATTETEHAYRCELRDACPNDGEVGLLFSAWRKLSSGGGGGVFAVKDGVGSPIYFFYRLTSFVRRLGLRWLTRGGATQFQARLDVATHTTAQRAALARVSVPRRLQSPHRLLDK